MLTILTSNQIWVQIKPYLLDELVKSFEFASVRRQRYWCCLHTFHFHLCLVFYGSEKTKQRWKHDRRKKACKEGEKRQDKRKRMAAQRDFQRWQSIWASACLRPAQQEEQRYRRMAQPADMTEHRWNQGFGRCHWPFERGRGIPLLKCKIYMTPH